jgi:uncharacterized lipoprotein
MNNSTLMITLALASLLLLTACAQSPQAIRVVPNFSAPIAQDGRNSPVNVRVSDNRQNKVLGSRGGTYRDTSVITIANNLSLAVEKPLAKHMAAMGYDTDSLSVDTLDLHVIFDSLVYNHPIEKEVGHDMEMLASVNVEARRGNEHYEGRYRVKRKQKFFNAPNESRNAELVNELVVEVLSSMFEDPKLVAFLRGN